MELRGLLICLIHLCIAKTFTNTFELFFNNKQIGLFPYQREVVDLQILEAGRAGNGAAGHFQWH